MRRLLSVLAFLLFVPASLFAQKSCKKGIPCGGTCIAANKTCHVGSSTSAPQSPTDAAPRPSSQAPDSTGSVDTASAAGKVWVNTKSHVYHCAGSRYYGTTKNGTYMTESAAKAAGNRPAYGKACGS